MTSQQELPKTHRALILTSRSEPLKVTTLSTPQPTPGSAIVRILVANVISYMREVYDGTRPYTFPTPMVTGTNAIGRVVAVGPDATSLKLGQLVLVDSTIRGRDDPTAIMLSGIIDGDSEGSKKLMQGEWRNSNHAEYAKVPLENCNVLDEKRLLGRIGGGGLGYSVEDLAYISAMLVPYGGLNDIGVKPGETIIVAPATGSFGGAAVLVALAMGARVIAMGRNVETLNKVAAMSELIEAVPITGNIEADTAALKQFGTVDAFFDISPPAAAQSTHIKSGILALRHSGRVSLMGGIMEDILIPHRVIMRKNLQLKGKWMYERADIHMMIKMIEAGVLKLGKKAGINVVGKYGLDDWDSAFTTAAANNVLGAQTLLIP
ncbi:hypothetical protein MMC14_009218 [Varicellaria rhodocarpa]|nr:hypothetical protein [Varicellaria rhodocarpa]